MNKTQEHSFDAAYYRRFYRSAKTRVQGKKEVARLARGITFIIEWTGAPIETVLDVGAGTGLWRDWFARHFAMSRRSWPYCLQANALTSVER